MDTHGYSTRQQILATATSEFQEKGFRDASLRAIAKKAGVTTGSVYWHFPSKDALFDALVGQEYQHLLQMYDDAPASFWNKTGQEQEKHIGHIGSECMLAMVDYMYQHQTSCKLLFCAASGTPYENLIHELTLREIASNRQFAEHLRQTGHPMPHKVEPELEHSIISGMFEALCEFVVHAIPKETAMRCARQLYLFYSAGWRALMGI